MASLRRKPGIKFWYACITLPDGTRRQYSTKTEDEAEARRQAEEAEHSLRAGHSEAEFLEHMRQVYRRFSPGGSGMGWLKMHAGQRKPEVSASHYGNLKRVCDELVDFAERHGLPALDRFGVEELLVYRKELLDRRLSPQTVNLRFRILRSVFAEAARQDVIGKNPAPLVRMLKYDDNGRRAFERAHIDALIAAADDDWTGMVLGGYWTGQRINDLANTLWEDLDLAAGTWSLRTQKTGDRLVVPLAPDYLAWLMARAGDEGGHVFPALAGRPSTRLSARFGRLMAKAGIDADPVAPDPDGAGGVRVVHRLSFHSLRHSLTSDLKAAGVSEAVAMALVGHKSRAVSQRYTHIDTETLRAALKRIGENGG